MRREDDGLLKWFILCWTLNAEKDGGFLVVMLVVSASERRVI